MTMRATAALASRSRIAGPFDDDNRSFPQIACGYSRIDWRRSRVTLTTTVVAARVGAAGDSDARPARSDSFSQRGVPLSSRGAPFSYLRRPQKTVGGTADARPGHDQAENRVTMRSPAWLSGGGGI